MSASQHEQPGPSARRTGRTAFVVAGLFAVLGVFAFAISSFSPEFPVSGGVFIADAVLTALVGAISMSVAGRYPAVSHLGGPLDLVRVATAAAAVGGIVALVAVQATPVSILGLAIVFVASALSVIVLAGAVRRLVRSPDATLPRS